MFFHRNGIELGLSDPLLVVAAFSRLLLAPPAEARLVQARTGALQLLRHVLSATQRGLRTCSASQKISCSAAFSDFRASSESPLKRCSETKGFTSL